VRDHIRGPNCGESMNYRQSGKRAKNPSLESSQQPMTANSYDGSFGELKLLDFRSLGRPTFIR